MTTGVEEILNITKGYLKDAWSLAGALVKEPSQAFADISKGLAIAPKTDGDYPVMKNVLTFGGLGATVGGLFILGNAFTGAMGIGATFLGLGRYHAIGKEERLKAEEVKPVAAESVSAAVDEPEGENITLPPPPKTVHAPEAHL